MFWPAVQDIRSKSNFFLSNNYDFSGLIETTKKFQLWPFWPKLKGIKVLAKFVTLQRFLVKCVPVRINLTFWFVRESFKKQ